MTYHLAETLQITRPYLFVDVEPYVREGIFDLREDLSGECNALWHRDAAGEGSTPLELPDSAVPKADGQAESVRARLKECQAADASLGPILRAKLEELDPKRAASRKGDSRANRLVTDQYRLAPTDGVLEYKVVLTTAVIWVPVIPEGEWRYWVFR